MKCSVFIAMSLDGFIARSDGNIDWLIKANELAPKGEDGGYHAFIAGIDVIVMGRYSYEKVLSFESWPYTLPVIVLSHREINVPAHLVDKVSFSSESPKSLVSRLSKAGLKNLYIDGGVTIQQFLNEQCIDDLIITIIPTLIGQGKRLFGKLKQDIDLQLVNLKNISGCFVQMHYKVSNHHG